MQVGQCLLKRSKESGWGRAPPAAATARALRAEGEAANSRQTPPLGLPAPASEERGGDRAGSGQMGWKLSVLLPQPSPNLPRLHRTDPDS